MKIRKVGPIRNLRLSADGRPDGQTDGKQTAVL